MLFCAGVPLAIIDQETVKDPASLLKALSDLKVTHLTAVPTLLAALARLGKGVYLIFLSSTICACRCKALGSVVFQKPLARL